MKWAYIILACSTMLVLGLADNIRGPVFPDLLREFGLTDTLGAVFFSLASGCAVLMNLASVWWLKRWGPLKSTQFFQVAMTLGLLIIGYGHSLTSLFLGTVFVGISFGGTGISQNLLVAWGAPPAFRRKSYSTLHAIYGLASLLAPLLVTLFYGMQLSWHSAFAAVGWLSVVVGVGAFFVNEYTNEPEYPATSFQNLQVPLRTVVEVSSLISLYVVAEIIIGTRIVLLANREWGFQISVAAGLQSLFYLLMLGGRMLTSIWHVRVATRNLLLVSLGLSLATFCLGLMIHPGVLAICGLTMSIFFPCSMAYIYERYHAAADSIIAWTMTMNSLFVMVMHYAIGWLSDVYGLKRAIWLGPCCLGVALIMLIAHGDANTTKAKAQKG